MDPSFGAGDLGLFPTSYPPDHPIFSPDPLEQLHREEDFLPNAHGIIQPDPSSFQSPAPTQIPKPNPSSTDHSCSPEPLDLEQFVVEDLLAGDKDDDTAAPMEIAPLTGTSTSMGKAAGELGIISSHSPETNGTDLKQSSGGGGIDLSTTTDREIMDHFRALAEEHRRDKDKEVDDDLAQLEPWELPVGKRIYVASNTLDLVDEKKVLGGAGWWKEADFRCIRPSGPYHAGKMTFMALRRTLEFYDRDGTRTEWRMFEWIWLHVSDGHMLVEDDYGVTRHVFHRLSFQPFSSNTSRISGVGEEDNNNQNRGPTCTLHTDCLHHHHTVPNDQTPSSPSGKRPRTDNDPKKKAKLNVWRHFTRIYVKVPKEAGSSSKGKKDDKKLIYAVCNYCDKVFKADSKQGTSHHSRHAESCLRKHSQPISSKSCSQDMALVLGAREVTPHWCNSPGL